MRQNKNDLLGLSTRALLTRRRRLAGRLGDVERLLAGSLVEQARRCGKPGCRCAVGDPHGPYAYFVPKTAGRGRMKYVPSGLITAVRAGLARAEQVDTVLGEISVINTELLVRRELT
ncbi:MAG: hypothetical protein LC700_00455 [Actinobacteria bacterium]|nr:hypothetical protein [Actinomycetota bacterium]